MSREDGADRSSLARLREEHDALEIELSGLRDFLDCMVRLMRTMDDSKVASDPTVMLEMVLDNAIRAIGASDASVLAPDRRTDELVFVLVRGENTGSGLLGKRVPPGRGVAAWVAESRRATIVNDAGSDDRFYSELDMQLQYETRSLLAAPLVGGGRLLGVVEMVNKRDGRLFTTGNQTLLTLICRFAGELLHEQMERVDLTQSEIERGDREERVENER